MKSKLQKFFNRFKSEYPEHTRYKGYVIDIYPVNIWHGKIKSGCTIRREYKDYSLHMFSKPTYNQCLAEAKKWIDNHPSTSYKDYRMRYLK